MVNESHVVSLLSLSATDIAKYGAKVANLAKAVQLGFTVPKGLAVSKACTENEFAIIAQDIIINELTFPVAVRSSAIDEDSKTKTYAGQFKTYLGIGTIDALVSAFSKVKNSGTAEHVKNYHGEAFLPEQIAVLVQRMVLGVTRSGIAFSKDPVSGESKIIIESAYGLGKSVVDGSITPDSIEYFSDGTYKTHVGRKSTQITLTDNGVREQVTPEADSQRNSLADEEIRAIAELTQNVEHDLGFAIDIEWAYDADGILWLLQARPITTL